MAVSKSNFFKDHYDWLVALVGVAALAGAGFLFVDSLGNTPDAARAACEAELKQNHVPANKDVPTVEKELSLLVAVTNGFMHPVLLDTNNVSDVDGSFLASEYRVRCKKCRRPIPFGSKACTWPKCDYKPEAEKPEDAERKGADLDGDGMTDAWEKRYGLNPDDRSDADKDADGDLFTNLEEFNAKTNPRDPEDHPDYLDDLTIVGTLDTKTLPFWISNVTPMAGGNYRVWFNATDPKFNAKKVSAVKGEEIAFMLKGAKWNAKPEKSGWRIAKVEKKTRKAKKAGAGQEIDVDDYVIDLERMTDKVVKSVPWKVKSFPVEEQIGLQWNRGEGKTFTVAKGTEFELNKRKYKVEELRKDRVIIVDLKTKEKRAFGEKASESKSQKKSASAAKPSPGSKPSSNRKSAP